MIARWHLILLRRAITARLPAAGALRRINRRLRGYEPNPSNIESTFSDLRRLYRLMRSNHISFRGTVLEIGTGWFPIASIIARLAGAERVILTDIVPLMDHGTFLTAKQIVLDHLPDLTVEFDLDSGVCRDALAEVQTAQQLGLSYAAPFDIATIPEASLDLIMSRACLEHIPSADLETLMIELLPKLKCHDGFMAHAIDNSDHFAHLDRTLSRVNFLTWSVGEHRLIWQIAKGGENRLRHHQYAALFQRCGFEVLGDEAFVQDEVLRGLSALKLASPYDRMTPRQLAAVTSWFVLKPRVVQR